MFTFKSGIHPRGNKELSKYRPIRSIKPKNIVVYPVNQHIGAAAKEIVKVGDNVLVGQIIAEADGFVSANVLSTVSGTVKAIENRLTVNGNSSKCIVIENDFQYTTIENYGNDRDYKELSRDEIVNIVKDAGIVGLGGACFPTHVKLTPKNIDKIEYLLINGAECEPYLTSDYRQMLENTDRLIKGTEILLKLFPKAKAIICIEDNKKDAFELINNKLSNNMSISTALLKTKYPQGGERQLIYAITNRKLYSKILPADIGVIVQNVSTVIAIYNAVCKNIPLLSKVLTITGNAVNDTGNIEVCFGCSYQDVIDDIGGFKYKPVRIINGGPMMGTAIYDLNVPISKNSSSILAFSEEDNSEFIETNCINCGRCVNACPINLTPVILYKKCKSNDIEAFIKLYGQECIECGACSYVCPAKKPLTQYFKNYKILSRNFEKKEIK